MQVCQNYNLGVFECITNINAVTLFLNLCGKQEDLVQGVIIKSFRKHVMEIFTLSTINQSLVGEGMVGGLPVRIGNYIIEALLVFTVLLGMF